MRHASRPRSSPSAGRPSKSPGSIPLRASALSSRPPFNVYGRGHPSSRDDSPSTSRHHLQRVSSTSPSGGVHRARSPVVSRVPVNGSTSQMVRYPPHEWSMMHQHHQNNSLVLPGEHHHSNVSGEQQLELFGKLQQVVVQLTHSAADEKAKQVRMQQRLDSYEVLVKDQDRMICELRAMNSRLQKERDALSTFRQGANDPFHFQNESVISNTTPSRQQAPAKLNSPATGAQSTLFHNDEFLATGGTAVTPKTKSFVQSLVDQLKEEKRLRYQVEEQSSRMIGEQQLTIHRLEDRLVRNNSTNGGSSPAGGRSPRASVGATARVASFAALHSPGDDEHIHREPCAPLPSDAARSFVNPSPSDDGPSVRVTVCDDHPRSSRSDSTDAASTLSMENASLLLQQIKMRHGL